MIARLVSPLRPPYPRHGARPLVLAHRGASADAPENTRAAFAEAVRQGADGVELDVRTCGTGELVVCHDAWLDRLAGEHLEVAATPLARLRTVDVGRRAGARFAGETIPTLEDVLDALPGGFVVNVEVKSERHLDPAPVRALARVLRRDGGRRGCVVSSFNAAVVAHARVWLPRVPVAMLVAADRWPAAGELVASALLASGLHVEHPLCVRPAVERWRRRGLAVGAWTVDAADDVERCREAGVDVLITNRPGEVRAALDPPLT